MPKKVLGGYRTNLIGNAQGAVQLDSPLVRCMSELCPPNKFIRHTSYCNIGARTTWYHEC